MSRDLISIFLYMIPVILGFIIWSQAFGADWSKAYYQYFLYMIPVFLGFIIWCRSQAFGIDWSKKDQVIESNIQSNFVEVNVIYSPLIDLCTSLLTKLHSVQVKESTHNIKTQQCLTFLSTFLSIYLPSYHEYCLQLGVGIWSE